MFLTLSLGVVAGGVALHQALQIAQRYLAVWGDAVGGRLKSGRDAVLLVTAHPDDECMFFAPTVRALFRAGVPVRLLCLSTGDRDGRGRVRPQELARSCRILGIASCTVLDRLPDGPENVWPAGEIEAALEDYFAAASDGDAGDVPITTLLTFDRRGVSGHPNHCDVSRGVIQFACSTSRAAFNIIELETVPLLSKYLGLLGIIYEFVLCYTSRLMSGKRHASPSKEGAAVRTIALMPEGEYYGMGVGAMRQHVSQLVWYRYLYLLCSRYMHVNTLILRTPIAPPPGGG